MEEKKAYISEEEDGVLKVRTCAWSPPGDHPVGCSMFLSVKDGKVVKVEGDPDHPITHGRLCPRCLALDEVMYHKDRILHPMKRAAEDRGKDAFQQISWDEAYDIIEKKVRENWRDYGPETSMVLVGTGREATMYAAAYATTALMTPNQGSPQSGAACYTPRVTVVDYMLGAGYPELDYAAFLPGRYEDPRYEIPKYILIWGKNPIYSNGDGLFGHAVIDLMKLGSKLIVVDPRVTWLATRAEYHLQLRPGTDAAVAMAMANVIISEDLYNHEFVEQWCYGFKDYADCVAEWTPEKAEEVTWVPANVIREAARAFAQNAPSSALWGLAMDTQRGSVQACQSFLAIIALCGYYDIPGGVTLTRPSSFIGKWRFDTLDTLPEEIRSKAIIDLNGKYRLYNQSQAHPAFLGDALLAWMELENPPYPIKLCWWVGCNAISCMAEQPLRWKAALDKVEFHIFNEIFMTPSVMAFADIVLPLSTFAEHDGVVLPHFGRNAHIIGAMNKAVEPEDTKSDLEILMEIGKRLRPELWEKYDTVSDFFTEQLQTVYDWGFSDLQDMVVFQQPFEYKKYETGGLRADGEPGFETPTGLIELKSTVYPIFGEKALPYFEEPEYSPFSNEIDDETKKKYPLVFTNGGRNLGFFHSEHRQIESLRKLKPWPIITIHPDTAAEYGIQEGDWVAMENPLGRCVQKAHISTEIDPRVVHAEHGWWFPEQDGEEPNLYGTWKANINNLVPTGSVGVTGYGAPYKNVICRIEKVDGLDG